MSAGETLKSRPVADASGSDSTMVDVSVCIANWNCREYLHGCLKSLRSRQGVSLEIIVVDNASTDGAAAMVAQEFPEVQLIRNETNRGFGRANNQAAKRAQGRFLFFLNNDTLVPAGTLARLVEFLETNPGASLVGPLLRDGVGQVQASFRQKPTLGVFLHRTLLLRWTGLWRRTYQRYRRPPSFPTEKAWPVEVLMGAALMVRRDLFQTMGGWDETFHFGGEDLELCLRAQRFGPVVYLPGVEITHFGRASTRENIAFASTQIAIGFVQYLRKSGCSRWGILAYKLATTLDAPVQILVKGIQFLFRQGQGRTKEADRSLNILKGLGPFLVRGMIPFWRA